MVGRKDQVNRFRFDTFQVFDAIALVDLVGF